MPGIVKIGRTKKNPQLRADTLYKSATGVPQQFRIEFAVYVDDCIWSETFIHRRLNEFRVNNAREFFKLNIDDAVKYVASHSIGKWDLCADTMLGYVIDHEAITDYAERIGKPPSIVCDALANLSDDELLKIICRLDEEDANQENGEQP
jgi:hypothetical protein